jgi:hypothetical protein
MKKNRLLFVVALIIGIVAWSSVVLTGKSRASTGAVNPLEQVMMEKGCTAFLFFPREDVAGLPEGVPRGERLYCDDVRTLERLRNYFVFVPSGGDMATCESKLIIYNETEQVFYSGIAISPTAFGIQGPETGWADAAYGEELTRIFSEFRKCKP